MTTVREIARHKLAAALAAARNDWNLAGIDRALRDSADTWPDETIFDLAIAAWRAASVASNMTPAVIAMNGPHRQQTRAQSTSRTPLALHCDEHGETHARRPDGTLACCAATRLAASETT